MGELRKGGRRTHLEIRFWLEKRVDSPWFQDSSKVDDVSQERLR